MNQTQLKKRYGLTSKQLVESIQANLDDLNQDGIPHARIENGHWVLDDTAVETFDKILHYVPDLPVQSTDSKLFLKTENEELKAQNKELRDYLLKANQTLEETKANYRNKEKEYERQLEDLTKQVYDTQAGQKNINENLIRKYKIDAENAKKSLEYEREKSRDKIDKLNKLVNELQVREKNSAEQLKKFYEFRAQYVALQTQLTMSGEEQQKLLNDLREKNEYISRLEDLVNKAKDTNINNEITNTSLIKDVNFALKDIISVISTLQSSIDEHTISEDAPRSLNTEIETVSERQRRLMAGRIAQAQTEEDVEKEGAKGDAPQEAPEDVSATEAQAEIKETVEVQISEGNTPVAGEDVSTETDALEEASSDNKVVSFKGAKKLKEDNEHRDEAINVLRSNQEKMLEEIQAENENQNKGILAKIASYFLSA